MSAAYSFKKVIGLLLILCILTISIPIEASINTDLRTAEASVIYEAGKYPALREAVHGLVLDNTGFDKALLAERGSGALNPAKAPVKSQYEESIVVHDATSMGTENAYSGDAFVFTKEHEESLNSLLSQLGTKGISLWSVRGDKGAVSPSGIDHGTRVSYEISEYICADYVSEHVVSVKFKLNKPSLHKVTFDYTVYPGSAIAIEGKHYNCMPSGEICLEAGETEKELEITISKLVNNPTEYGLPSDRDELWTKDRVLYINCSNIKNALFDNEKESMTVLVPIGNQFDFRQAYQNALNTYLVDLSNLSDATSFPDTPGKYINIEDELKIAAPIPVDGDVRKMIDTGVFSHINMPVGYFLNESSATSDIWFRIYGKNKSEPNEKSISVDGKSETDFNLGELPIEQVWLGPSQEINAIVLSLDFVFDYSTVTDAVYTCFTDRDGKYLQNQVNLTDKIKPYVASVDVPTGTFHFGESIPITVRYREPVIADDISITANGTVLYPMERKDTISEAVSFLYEVDENYEGSIAVTNVTGATDLSGKTQEESGEYNITAALAPFDPEKSFSYCAETAVNIDQGESINAKGEIVVSIRENVELSNWFADKVQPDKLLPVVKAKVIGKEGGSVDVPLYANYANDGPVITELRGEFDAPANLTDQSNYYVAEIYFSNDTPGEFELVYGLSKEYAILPIVFIDDDTDLEIVYTNWPPADKVSADNKAALSLGYKVNNNATWQRPKDFTWSSSDENVATIDSGGSIALTGQPGKVAFTLTALNAGLSDRVSVVSKTLEVLETESVFLNIPDSVKDVQITKGNNAKIYYSTNITAKNDLYIGSGTVTTYSYDLYEAIYVESELQKGSLVYRLTFDDNVETGVFSHTVDSRYLVNTSARGKYSYILEVSAKDLESDEVLSASANICVKELPARAVLNRPQKYYTTDEASSINVSFHIENRSANTEYFLSVIKNEETEPVFSTGSPIDMDRAHTVTISPVDDNRLLDIYTVSLKAKNEFDEAFSYDSYAVYVYNSDALSIMVNGVAADHLTMSPNENLSTMTSEEILALNRQINLTDEVSINKKQYKWSSIADKITWKVGNDGRVSLKYNDGGVYRDIGDLPSNSFLPCIDFLLQGDSSGDSFVTATHDFTGMEAKLDVTVDKVEDKLYIFQVYPSQKCNVIYSNGLGRHKNVETDDNGRLAVYEESGIVSDVVFEPEASGVYECGSIRNNELVANQKSLNHFGLYPQNNIVLARACYKVELRLFHNPKGIDRHEWYYEGDVIIRGGVYRNGIYCPNAKINGKIGSKDQVVSVDDLGRYVLSFDASEFTTKNNLNPLTYDDTLEYIFEVSFPDESYSRKIIKIDNTTIKIYKYYSCAVYREEPIQRKDPANIVNIVSQTLIIDGKEQQVPELIVFDEMPESAVLYTEMHVLSDRTKDHDVEFVDDYWTWILFSHTSTETTYEFSDTVILRNTFDLHKRLFYLNPGEITGLYMNIRTRGSGSSREIKLSKPIKLQSLIGIPKMDESLSKRALKDILNDIKATVGGPSSLNFDGDNARVKKALDFLKSYSISTDSMRLEITPTDDPLVYKGVIKFAAGDLTRENPSGVYMADESSSESFNFMPGLSNVKAIKKGDYIQKSKKEMEQHKDPWKKIYKTYGGGAYLECDIFYDIDSEEWKILLLKSDVYLGAGGGYRQVYNTWVGPVPITAEFATGISAQIGLKTVAEKLYHDDSKEEYDIVRNYITELRPYGYIYGFGGFGQDYYVASLKVGLYGQISLDNRFLWHNREKESANGQKITISGKTGIKFQASVLFINYTKKYELGGVSKSWTYNDFNKIEKIYDSKLGAMFLSSYGDYPDMVLEPAGETSSFEGRTYLDTFDRQWYAPMLRALFAEDKGIVIVQTNTYPYSNPMFTNDGGMMVYISDMDSEDIKDTAICFTRKGLGGAFPEGTEIYPSPYPDTDMSIDGTGDGAVVAWTRVISDFGKSAGEVATSEDAHSMLSGTEIMAGVYKDGSFTTTRLTENNTPDMAPVAATNGAKAIVAWRSLYASDMEKPLDFDGRDNIMYRVFDGASWGEAKCLYDGTIDKVNTVNAAMLPDGTSAITYSVKINGTENTEIICAVIDADGNIIDTIRLTNNEVSDENPRITPASFPDGIERFVIGWNTVKTLDDGSEENIIRLSAVNKNGALYPQFEKEIEDNSGVSNYRSFQFTKGADKLEDLSIVWTEPTLGIGGGISKDIIWGRKLIQEADGDIAVSSKIKLLELDDNNVVDFFDSYVDEDTKEINFALLITEYNRIDEETEAKLATAKSGYKNNLVVQETYFSPDDILPGLDMPVLFSLYNEGVEPIKKVTVNLGGASSVFDGDIIKPGEYKDLAVFYTVPQIIVNPDYSVTAEFSTSTDTKTGKLNMDVPDVGIYNIDIIREIGRERSFNVLLRNGSFSKLKPGKHKVRLEVYDTPDFNNGPVAVETISDTQSLDRINDGALIHNVTLSEENLQGVLDYAGEIPKDGVWIYFNTVIVEDDIPIEDADISNDTDYIKIYSLLTKYGVPISIASVMEAEADRTTAFVEAFNNSMNEITNGNITVSLKDGDGRILETRQTYNVAGDGDTGLIVVKGEETVAQSFNFDKAGDSVDVIFTRVAGDSKLLSVLRLNGVPLDFDNNINNYDLQVTDLNETFITAVAENPNSVIMISRNGAPISNFHPCTLVYGVNRFDIAVITGENEVIYTVNVRNTKSSAAVAPAITTITLAGGAVGREYRQTLTATGDTPVTWSIDSGSLPAGLTLNTLTGVISGTPATAGISNFTVRATNSAGYDAKALNIGIASESGDDYSDNDRGAITPSYNTSIAIGGSKQPITRPITVDTAAGSITVNLGDLAWEIFAGDEDAIITVPSIPGVKAYILEMPAASLTGSPGEVALTFDTGVGSVLIRGGMLSEMSDLGGKAVGITIAAGDRTKLSDDVKASLGDRPLIELMLTLDGVPTPWNNPDVPVTVNVPYTPTATEMADPEHIVIWYIDDRGSAVSVPNGRYNPETGTVTFTASHFSYFAVVYVHKTFGDMSGVEWAREAIEVMSSKGIIKGTSTTSYSPAANITRADYLVLLVRTLGLTANFEDNFDDVQPGVYYYEAAGIAKKLGIAMGTFGNRFHPGDSISRQDMMVMTSRALEKFGQLKAPDDDNVLDIFSDKEDIAGYAKSSLTALVKEGLITGSGSKLNPRALTTRAEAAVFLYRIYSKY